MRISPYASADDLINDSVCGRTHVGHKAHKQSFCPRYNSHTSRPLTDMSGYASVVGSI